MKHPRPLITRLRAARKVLREERAVIYDSECHPDGSVDEDAQRLLDRFHEAAEACAEAVRLLKGRAP